MKKLEEVRVDIEELERLEKEANAEAPWVILGNEYIQEGNGWSILESFEGKPLADFIVATRNALPSLIKELEVLRESVKRFEGMEISNFEETMEDYKGLNAVNNLWKHKRDIISAWVKEQLEE